MSTIVRFTTHEFERMIEEGIFGDRNGDRLELILGEVREMTPPNPPHEDVVDLLAAWSYDNTSRKEVRVRVQNSVGIPEFDSVPIPDVAWVRERSYRRGRPEPSDVLLLIEVAATSLASDRGEKSQLYASAGIADYWIVNLQTSTFEVYREPEAGEYRERRTFVVGDTVSPLAFPDLKLSVGDLFGA